MLTYSQDVTNSRLKCHSTVSATVKNRLTVSTREMNVICTVLNIISPESDAQCPDNFQRIDSPLNRHLFELIFMSGASFCSCETCASYVYTASLGSLNTYNHFLRSMGGLLQIYDATFSQILPTIDASFYWNFSTFVQLDQNFRPVVEKWANELH